MESEKRRSAVKYIFIALAAVFILLVLVNFILPMMSGGMMEDDFNNTEINVDLDENASGSAAGYAI